MRTRMVLSSTLMTILRRLAWLVHCRRSGAASLRQPERRPCDDYADAHMTNRRPNARPDSCHRGVSPSGDLKGIEDVLSCVGQGVCGDVFVSGDADGDLL